MCVCIRGSQAWGGSGCSRSATYKLIVYTLDIWVLEQPLVTGQVSHCTGDGGASAHLVSSCLMVWVHHFYLKPFVILQKTGYLVCLGTSLGRFMRGQTIYVPFGVKTWHYVGVMKGGCDLPHFIFIVLTHCLMVVIHILVWVYYYLLFPVLFYIFLCFSYLLSFYFNLYS